MKKKYDKDLKKALYKTKTCATCNTNIPYARFFVKDGTNIYFFCSIECFKQHYTKSKIS